MKRRKSRLFTPSFIFSLVLFIVVFAVVTISIINGEKGYGEERLKVAQEAVVRAVVSCYAIEGVYPPNVQYLKDHYGLSIDETAYFVHYETYGSNLMPKIQVFSRFAESGNP